MIVLTVLLGLFTVATSIISGVVGMAGGITLVSLMTFILPMEKIVPIHAVVQLVANAFRAFYLRKNIIMEISFFFILGAPIGTAGAYFVFSQIDSKTWLYWPILLLIGYALFKPKKMPGIRLANWGFFGLGMLAGFLGPLIGATGPLMAPFFLRNDLNKEEIVATKALTQMFTHLLKIPLFMSLNFSYSDFSLTLLVMVLGAIVGTKIGVMLLGKTSERLFRKIYMTALAVAASRLIWKIFF